MRHGPRGARKGSNRSSSSSSSSDPEDADRQRRIAQAETRKQQQRQQHHHQQQRHQQQQNQQQQPQHQHQHQQQQQQNQRHRHQHQEPEQGQNPITAVAAAEAQQPPKHGSSQEANHPASNVEGGGSGSASSSPVTGRFFDKQKKKKHQEQKDKRKQVGVEPGMEVLITDDSGGDDSNPNADIVADPDYGLGQVGRSWEEIRPLGSGAFGEVILARYWRQGQKVEELCAVKRLKAGAAGGGLEDIVQLAEVQALQSLNHPCILRLFEVAKGKDSATVSLVMEYADSGDLQQLLKKRSETASYLSPMGVLALLAQLATAIQHVHSQKVLHRDLKPSNVLMTSLGIAKLGDFGVAKIAAGTSVVDQMTCVGSPTYMAPEVVGGHAYGAPCDIWSLGVLLYETCCFRRPFEGRSLGELIMRITSGHYEALEAVLSGGIGQVLASVVGPLIAKMLSLEMQVRCTAKEILRDDVLQVFVSSLRMCAACVASILRETWPGDSQHEERRGGYSKEHDEKVLEDLEAASDCALQAAVTVRTTAFGGQTGKSPGKQALLPTSNGNSGTANSDSINHSNSCSNITDNLSVPPRASLGGSRSHAASSTANYAKGGASVDSLGLSLSVSSSSFGGGGTGGAEAEVDFALTNSRSGLNPVLNPEEGWLDNSDAGAIGTGTTALALVVVPSLPTTLAATTKEGQSGGHQSSLDKAGLRGILRDVVDDVGPREEGNDDIRTLEQATICLLPDPATHVLGPDPDEGGRTLGDSAKAAGLKSILDDALATQDARAMIEANGRAMVEIGEGVNGNATVPQNVLRMPKMPCGSVGACIAGASFAAANPTIAEGPLAASGATMVVHHRQRDHTVGSLQRDAQREVSASQPGPSRIKAKALSRNDYDEHVAEERSVGSDGACGGSSGLGFVDPAWNIRTMGSSACSPLYSRPVDVRQTGSNQGYSSNAQHQQHEQQQQQPQQQQHHEQEQHNEQEQHQQQQQHEQEQHQQQQQDQQQQQQHQQQQDQQQQRQQKHQPQRLGRGCQGPFGCAAKSVLGMRPRRDSDRSSTWPSEARSRSSTPVEAGPSSNSSIAAAASGGAAASSSSVPGMGMARGTVTAAVSRGSSLSSVALGRGQSSKTSPAAIATLAAPFHENNGEARSVDSSEQTRFKAAQKSSGMTFCMVDDSNLGKQAPERFIKSMQEHDARQKQRRFPSSTLLASERSTNSNGSPNQSSSSGNSNSNSNGNKHSSSSSSSNNTIGTGSNASRPGSRPRIEGAPAPALHQLSPSHSVATSGATSTSPGALPSSSNPSVWSTISVPTASRRTCPESRPRMNT